MPTTDDVSRALGLATSPDALDYFYDHLTSPGWIPALRELRLFDSPPEPIEQPGSVSFPGWALSRYLVRVAPQAPMAVAEALADIEHTRNPRIQRDIVDCLLAMPPEHSVSFIPSLARWIHHPYRLELARPVARLAEALLSSDAQAPALVLARSVVELVPPVGWPADQPWVPLDDYEYGETIPGIATGLACVGLDGTNLLVSELSRFLEAEYAPSDAGPARDLSYIWRPALEDHQQNRDFELQAKLLVAIRNAITVVLERHPGLLDAAIRDLLSRPWASIKRTGLYLLTKHGLRDLGLVRSVLTDAELFGDVDVHHEFYNLAKAYFGQLPAEAQLRYVQLVAEVSTALTAEDEPAVALRRQRWWARNRLGAVADYLPTEARDRLGELVEEFGPEEHPDFLSYHTSWSGPTSPLTDEEVSALDADALVDYLGGWRPEGDETKASPEGLGRVLSAVVKENPAAYAVSAPRYIDLEPAYARGLLFGLREGIRAGRQFPWDTVLTLCEAIVRQPVGADETAVDRGRDPGWGWCRREVASLLEAGLEDCPGTIESDKRTRVWSIIEALCDDSDPTPESEARFGSPNMDHVNYSINTVRGIAVHAVCGYATWLWRQSPGAEGWRLSVVAPEATRILDNHLETTREPSTAVRSVYGYWLPWLIVVDPDWVRANLDRLLGDLSSPGQLAPWDAYLVHGGGDNTSYDMLQVYYTLYASRLVGLADMPPTRISGVSPVERFVDHLFRLRDRMPRDDSALDILLSSGDAWLVGSIVENCGRIVHGAPELAPEVEGSIENVWHRIRRQIEARNDPTLGAALAPFGWWFASALSPGWTLPELLRVLEVGAHIDPEFLVLERLALIAQDHREAALTAVERIASATQEGWVLRTHEDDIRSILAAALGSDDGLVRARAEALANRLGRHGLQGLRSLFEAGPVV